MLLNHLQVLGWSSKKPWKQLLQLPPSRGGLGLAAFSEEGGLCVEDFGLYVMAAPPRFSMDTKNVALENVALFKYDVIWDINSLDFRGECIWKWDFGRLKYWNYGPLKRTKRVWKKTFKTLMVGKDKFVSLVETFVTRHLWKGVDCC